MPLDLPQPFNILVILSDQERAPQHWPQQWAERNITSTERLKETGISFERAFTNTCQCSPSRASLHTSTFPAEHLVTTTFGPGPGKSPQTLRSGLPNLARVLAAAGYHVAYKGKWHLNRPVSRPGVKPGTWTQADIEHLRDRFGYADWNPPDAGNSLSDLTTLGAGRAQHDRRYLTGRKSRLAGSGFGNGALKFLRDYDGDQPFCLFVSLINPHDVFVYPRQYRDAGFRLKDFKDLPIELPESHDEDLSTKPVVQDLLREFMSRHDPLRGERQALNYVRFYAWLHTVVDQQIHQLLDALSEYGWRESTLVVRTSDHGEMGMAHGGLRQKEYNCYEETLRIPLVFSNPRIFPQARTTGALASLIDLLPTLSALCAAPSGLTSHCKGSDLSPVLQDPTCSVQEHIHFTYDDDFLPDLGIPNYIRCLRAARWKYAVYYDPLTAACDYEMYDLESDPLELHNLARDPGSLPRRRQLHQQLSAEMMRAGTMPDSIEWPGLPFADEDLPGAD